MAARSFVSSLAFEEYSGKSRWLKHVCEVGSLVTTTAKEGARDATLTMWPPQRPTYSSESGPMRDITKRRLPKPLIGARSLPVAKDNTFFLSACIKYRQCCERQVPHASLREREPTSVNVCSTSQNMRMVGDSAVKPSSYTAPDSNASKSSSCNAVTPCQAATTSGQHSGLELQPTLLPQTSCSSSSGLNNSIVAPPHTLWKPR